MKDTYTQAELADILARTTSRRGWDFSSMRDVRAPVPWDYVEEVKTYLSPGSSVLDIGTGGGERFMSLSPHFQTGHGVDVDPGMIATARENANAIHHLHFDVLDAGLTGLHGSFDVIIDRHAPFNLDSVRRHLRPGGYFITQQVGERNMRNVKEALGQPLGEPPITIDMIAASGLECVAFREYDVEYVVQDIDSLVFWLNALDMLHADIPGSEALQSADMLNRILANHVDQRGFVTNEHRYLAVATRAG